MTGTASIAASLLASVTLPAEAAVFTPNSRESVTFTSAAPGQGRVLVDGAGASIASLEVTLHGLTNAHAEDVDIELVGPSGKVITLISDACSGSAFGDVTLTFVDDASKAPQNGACASGSRYIPTNYGPVDDNPYGGLGNFIGTNPDGYWTVRLADDTAGNQDNGILADGFDLRMTTNPFQALIPGAETQGVANPYPISSSQSRRTGTITDVNATLGGVSHTSVGDIDAILVSPAGTAVWLVSDACGAVSETNMFWTFDDEAAASLPAAGTTASCSGGSYRPSSLSDLDNDVLPAPAPAGPYSTSLSAFDGEAPNGTWRVYVVDDRTENGGYLTGFGLDISTAASAVPVPSAGATTTITTPGKNTVVVAPARRAPNTKFTLRRHQPDQQFARFAYRSTASPATFQCKLDKGPWRACGQRTKLSGLTYRRHWFKVRSIDAAGNVDKSPARESWMVLAPRQR